MEAGSLLKPIDKLLEDGRFDIAFRLLRSLRPRLKGEQWIEERLSELYRKWIPRYHFEMLNDAKRGQGFTAALDAVDLRDKVVLDIGAGTGLLSMLAVRRGARHVYACEMVEPMAEVAVETVRRNGMADRVTVIPRKSTDMVVGRDLPVRADVMVSETIDSGFVAEGFLPSLDHARKNLLKGEALLVPCAAKLRGMLIESANIHGMNHVDRSLGFDVSAINEFATRGYYRVRLKTRPHRELSEATTLIDLDLYAAIPQSTRRVIEFRTLEDGIVHGVVFWFEALLAPGVGISNAPDQTDSHWPQSFATFHEPVAAKKGAPFPIELAFRHDALSMAPARKAFDTAALAAG